MKTQKSNTATKKVVTKKATNEKEKNLIHLTDEQLLETLDADNLDEILLQKLSTIKTKRKDKKDDLYKGHLSGKGNGAKRTKIRKQRDTIIAKFLIAHNAKNISERNNALKEFEVFYKENYILNDFSFGSLSRNNADHETKLTLNMFLMIVRQIKSIK